MKTSVVVEITKMLASRGIKGVGKFWVILTILRPSIAPAKIDIKIAEKELLIHLLDVKDAHFLECPKNVGLDCFLESF